MIEVTKYQSSDGKLWDDKQECLEHEGAVRISEALVNYVQIDLEGGTNIYEIVKTLIQQGHIKLPE